MITKIPSYGELKKFNVITETNHEIFLLHIHKREAIVKTQKTKTKTKKKFICK